MDDCRNRPWSQRLVALALVASLGAVALLGALHAHSTGRTAGDVESIESVPSGAPGNCCGICCAGQQRAPAPERVGEIALTAPIDLGAADRSSGTIRRSPTFGPDAARAPPTRVSAAA